MSYQKILAIVGPILLGLTVLYGSVALPIPTGAASDVPEADLTYAATGMYPVGMQTTTTETDSALPLVLWYPAQNDANRSPNTTYPVEMKMGSPLGAVTVATYRGKAIHDAPFATAAEPYPLIVLSHGFSMGAMSYGWLAEHLASYGFVVVAPEHVENFDGELNGLWQAPATRPGDIVAVLDYIDAQTVPGATFENLIDAERVAVMGHSYGGYTTLAAGGAQIDTEALRQHCAEARADEHPAAWLCDEILPHLEEMATLAGFDAVPDNLWPLPVDPRIDAIVPMAGDAYFFGADGLSQITVPVMALGGTNDNDTPYEWGPGPTYEHVSSETKVRIGLVGAEHMIFVGPCEAIPLLLRLMSDEFCADGDWSNRYHAHNLVKHYTTAFLLAELQQDTVAASALTPENAAHPDITYTAQGY